MKPNVLPGVRVGQASMVNNLSLKGGGMLCQGPPGHRHTRGLSHFKCRQAPSIDGTIGTVGPLVPSTEGATIKTTAPVNIPSDVSRHSTCKVHFISWVNFCPERHKFNKWCQKWDGAISVVHCLLEIQLAGFKFGSFLFKFTQHLDITL